MSNENRLNNIYTNIYQNQELRNAISGAKQLIDKYVKDFVLNDSANFNGYQKVYINTNELIGEYLSLINLTNKNNALSVTSSGDHILNLITSGIFNIDSFDSNKLTEYIAFGLKFAMIIKYDYKNYINTLRIICNRTSKCETINEIISELCPLMDEKYRVFWKEILEYNNKIQKEYGINTNVFSIICTGFHPITTFMKNNNYLKNELSYNELKNNINRANITFTSVNALDIPKTFENKKYDIMLLSNIIDYFSFIWGIDWKKDKLNEYVYKLQKLMNKDGIILLNYIYLYKYLNPSYIYVKNDEIIQNSSVKSEELKDYEILELDPTSYGDISGVLLKRIK